MMVEHIDGSVLEGGGQLVRNAVALSALMSRPIRIDNIRHGRSPPGLKKQHAAGVRLVAEITSAELSGCENGSRVLEIHPGPIEPAMQHFANPGTAASTTLMLQIAMPPLLFSARPGTLTELILRGGTNAFNAPPIDHTLHVLLPFLQQHYGISASLEIFTRGYFPKGGGEVRVSVPSVQGPIPAVTLTERGMPIQIRGIAHVAGLPRHLADTMRNAALDVLRAFGIKETIIQIDAVREKPGDAVGSGSGIALWAETDRGCILGGSAIGSKGKDPAQVGKQAADELVGNLTHGGCVDEYMQDQIIIFLALAQGKSIVKTGPLSLHTKTAIWVAERLTDAKFEVHDDPSGTCTIHCEGIGFRTQSKDLSVNDGSSGP